MMQQVGKEIVEGIVKSGIAKRLPATGGTVIYREGDHDNLIYRQGKGGSGADWTGTNGTREHPALVTRVWSPDCINVTVFLDATGIEFRTSVMRLADLGPDVHNPDAGWRWA